MELLKIWSFSNSAPDEYLNRKTSIPLRIKPLAPIWTQRGLQIGLVDTIGPSRGNFLKLNTEREGKLEQRV